MREQRIFGQTLIAMALSDYPRADLVHAPTPLEFMPNLTAHLGGPDLYVKRDDCTGLALGGNKTRQLEYYLGAARAEAADTILITGAVQSNFVRQAAAAARKLGMDIHIQLENRLPGKDEAYLKSGNLLLDHLLGATIHHFSGSDEAAADARLEDIADKVSATGARPYVIHLSTDHPPLGALGYVDCAHELLAQMRDRDLGFDAAVVSSGSAATHCGLVAGLRQGGSAMPVHGICVRRDAVQQAARVRRRIAEVAAMLGDPGLVSDGDALVDDSWLAPGYGLASAEVEEALELAARTEGLILDPVYTAKAMAGLIGMIRRGDFRPGQNVLFLHTGGAPALFGYSQYYV